MKRESSLVGGGSRVEVIPTVNGFRWGKKKRKRRNEAVRQLTLVFFLETKEARTRRHEKRIQATEQREAMDDERTLTRRPNFCLPQTLNTGCPGLDFDSSLTVACTRECAFLLCRNAHSGEET